MLRYYRNLSFISRAAKLITQQQTRACLYSPSSVKPHSVLNKIDRLNCHGPRLQIVLLNQRSRFRYLGTYKYGTPKTKTSVNFHFVYRTISSKPSDHNEKISQQIVHQSPDPEAQITVGAKVAQAGKDASYLAVIIVGFAVTGALIWYVASELLFGFSPNKVYSDALKKVKENSEVINAVGEPMKAYGEETSRGRRRHVSYQEYIVNGENYMRVKFYVSGPKQKGTVHADVKQGSRGSYEFRFILVEFKGFPGTVIVLDNR